MPRTHVSVAYPGLRLRPDVYATHGHYLDLPLTVPRIESVGASGMARVTGRGRDLRSAADYEAALGPIYGFFGGLAEASPGRRSGGAARSRATSGGGPTARSRVGSLLLARAAIPAPWRRSTASASARSSPASAASTCAAAGSPPCARWPRCWRPTPST